MLPRICQWAVLLWLVQTGLSARMDEALATPLTDDPAIYAVRHWTTEDGLPQNRIACLQQTRDGYLWIGTWFGLARFDGVRFVVFNQQNTPALINDTISALTEDTDGTLWIGTGGGLVKYEDGKFYRFTPADGLPDNHIWQLASSATGGIWLAADGNIVRYEHDRFVALWKCPVGDTIHSMQEDDDGRLNIFLDHQWLVLSAQTGLMQTNFAESDMHDRFRNAGPAESAGTAFAGTAEGLRRLEPGKTNMMFAGGLHGMQVDFLLRDRSGNIWVLSQTNGLMQFDGTNWQFFDLGETRSDVVCTTQDAQGNFWFGTASGLVQLRFQKVRAITTREGLPDDNVWSVCESADGNLWAGTDRGLAMIQSNRASAFKIPGENPFQPIRCVWPTHDGGIWLASQVNGVLKFLNGEIAEQFRAGFSGVLTALFEDKSGRLWVGTSKGVSCFQNGQPKQVAEIESLRDVHAIHEDRDGNFWLGMNGGGLARWRDGQLSVFTARDGLADASVWCIHEDADGTLWLGTEKGLARMVPGHKGKFFQFTAQQQMPADTVNCILEDDAGCLWLSTLHGIYRVERAQLNTVADGKSTAVQPLIIGSADGMKTPESNGETQPAGWKARDGRLWFPTGKGLVVIDPRLFSENETPPRVVLESFKADGRQLISGTEGKIKITAGHGHALEFRFTASDLAAPEQVRFQTRMAGVEDEWSEPAVQRTADYFNLPPGEYRFEVKAADHRGLWSVHPATLLFSIAPYFWQTWWFYALCAMGVAGVVGGVQAYRLRWQHRLHKLDQQRALASERARIARDLHDDLGTALTGMALELDVLGRDAQSVPPLVERLTKASQHTRHLAERMREVVWVVNPRCDNLRSLADFLEDQAALLLRAAGLKVRLEFPLEIPELPMDANVRHQLALSVREAFTNLIRHARASEANVRLELKDQVLFIHIRDNGRGFEPQQHLDREHGMINMRVRMEGIGGCFKCLSAPGNGTTITFRVPLPIAINKKS